MERLQKLQNQLLANNTNNYLQKSNDDVVICCALRTPLTRAKRGPLKDTTPDVLLTHVFRGIL